MVAKKGPKHLDPVPVEQELKPILDIFTTPAVAAISKNVTSLMATTVDRYLRYCQLFLDGCGIPACASTVRLGNLTLDSTSTPDTGPFLFHYIKYKLEGRMVFLEEKQEYYMFFSKNRWHVGRNLTETDAMLSTSPCPQFGASFE